MSKTTSLRRLRLIGFSIAISLSATALFGQEVYTNWSYSAKIYLNTTANGANITSTITNFPVLVRLNTNNFPFSQALSLGADVRFANSAGTHLAYQIERWADNSAAEIWVKVDQITGNNATQYILMYWGKTGSVDSSRGSAVFDTSNGFKGVWHMGENPAPILDATIDKYTGFKGDNMSPTTGIIGNAQVFNGSSDYADMGNVLNPGTSNFTVSMWIKRGSAGLQTMMAKSNSDNPSATYGWILTFDPSDYLHTYVASGGAAWGDAATFHISSSTALTDLTSWHHVAAVIDKSGNANCRLYIDGIDQTGTATGNITGVGAITNTLNCRLATLSNNQSYFDGTMDEATVSFRARSADWIKLCYQNQKPNQLFVTVVENYSTWAHSTQFSINTSSSGANIASTLTNFPLLIRLTAANFPAINQTLSGGADVRFAKTNGMPLSYQIERWVDNTSAEIWVKVDQILGNNSSQSITMYWGKTGAVNMGRAPMVFDTANGFAGVWHLSNSNFNDATYNAANATNYGTTDTTAAIGNGRKFLSTDPDYMQVTGLMGSPSTVTLSCWAKLDSIDMAQTWSDLVSIGDNVIIRVVSNPGGTRDSLNTSYHYNGGWNITTTPGATNQIKKAGWKYLTGVFNPSGSSEIAYIDGASVASSVTTQALYYTGVGTNTFFGKHGNGQNDDFGGVLDEVRIDKTARSADWIKLCYQNQKPGSAVVCSGAPVITAQPSDAQVTSGDTASFTVTASGTNLVYQWQRSMNSGATWTNVTAGVGATSPTYKFKTDSTVDLNAQFHCVITACGTVTSSAAKLTFAGCTGGTPVITVQPSDAMVKPGDTASFIVMATGTGIVYQWQKSLNGGTSWTNVAGASATTANCKVRADTADTSALFHCMVTGTCGIVLSNAVTLTVILPAEAVILISPPDAGSILADSVILVWQKATRSVTKYHLQIATDSAMVFSLQDSTITDTTKLIKPLSNGQSYWWRVRAYNELGWGPFSRKSKFTVDIISIPGVVILLSPSDTAKIQTDSALLVWSKGSPLVTRYHIQIATDSAMTFALQDSTITDTTKLLKPLSSGQSYWWRVRAYNVIGWGAFSQKREFTYFTTVALPRQPKPLAFSFKVSSMVLRYALPSQCFVNLKYYDIRGKQVASFVNQSQNPGYYSFELPLSTWTRGMYIQVFKAGSFIKKDMVVVVR